MAAKKPSKKKVAANKPSKKKTAAKKRATTYQQALSALKAAGANYAEVGIHPKGLDDKKITRFMKGKAKGKTPRYVALNAPFKRRTPVPPV